MPQSIEIHANSINLHFHYTVLALVILLLSDLNGPIKHGLRFMLLVAGLSGIPPNFLVIVFVLKALMQRDRESIVHGAIMLLTCSVQISLLLQSDSVMDNREFEFKPVLTVFASVSQQILAPMFHATIAQSIANRMRFVYENYWLALFSATVVLVVFSIFYQRFKSALSSNTNWCFLACLVIVVLSISTSLGVKTESISGGFANGRYFYAPNVCLYLALAILVSQRFDRYLMGLMIVACCSSLIVGVRSTSEGLDWAESYNKAKARKTELIEIWPRGWAMRGGF